MTLAFSELNKICLLIGRYTNPKGTEFFKSLISETGKIYLQFVNRVGLGIGKDSTLDGVKKNMSALRAHHGLVFLIS